MNKRLLNLIALLACLFISATAYSQAVSISPATGGLASAAQIGGTNNIAVFGVQLTKAAGGGNTVTGLTIVTTPTATGKFTTARLYESTNATFDGIGSETLVVAGTINAARRQALHRRRLGFRGFLRASAPAVRYCVTLTRR